ncbi:unnamed protein product [Moneuplotes crassus]|uniref:Uncharacterized protein n=1 Tax=Euplotes crassus TaxID=5936 RepID=A0AAD1X9P8_EUPCR|nr:unnamed protein product [Moneuplotes crassus]
MGNCCDSRGDQAGVRLFCLGNDDPSVLKFDSSMSISEEDNQSPRREQRRRLGDPKIRHATLAESTRQNQDQEKSQIHEQMVKEERSIEKEHKDQIADRRMSASSEEQMAPDSIKPTTHKGLLAHLVEQTYLNDNDKCNFVIMQKNIHQKVEIDPTYHKLKGISEQAIYKALKSFDKKFKRENGTIKGRHLKTRQKRCKNENSGSNDMSKGNSHKNGSGVIHPALTNHINPNYSYNYHYSHDRGRDSSDEIMRDDSPTTYLRNIGMGDCEKGPNSFFQLSEHEKLQEHA